MFVKVGELKKESIIAGILLCVTVLYLAKINFSLPFMALDELRSISDHTGDELRLVLLYGRPSQIIAVFVNKLISFDRVTYVGLIPRFVAMLVLLYGLVLFARLLEFGYPASISLASLILLMHEIDWQHNGLVAFFGGYALMLGAFLIALYVDLKKSREPILWWGAVAIIFVTYASEFFVIVSASYLVLAWLAVGRNPLKSPFVAALVIYAILFFVAGLYSIGHHAQLMDNYLVGAVHKFSVGDVVLAFCIYLAGAIPHFEVSVKNAPYWALAILGTILPLLASGMIRLTRGGKQQRMGEIAVENLRIFFILRAIAALLVLLPPFLLSMQPSKVAWAINGDSNHYAFTLYEWVGLVLFGVSVVPARSHINLKKRSIVSISLGFLAAISIFTSIYQNILFVSQYTNSFKKWMTINEALTQNGEHVLLDKEMFKHPYIMSYDPILIKHYVKTVYSKTLAICSLPGVDLSEPINDHELGCVLCDKGSTDGVHIQLTNFYGAETGGRWTQGGDAKVEFVGHYQMGSAIFVQVGAVFGKNRNEPVVFRVGTAVVVSHIAAGSTIKVILDHDANNPTLHIFPASSTSPASLRLGLDDRNIGVMIRRVDIVAPGHNQESVFQQKICTN